MTSKLTTCLIRYHFGGSNKPGPRDNQLALRFGLDATYLAALLGLAMTALLSGRPDFKLAVKRVPPSFLVGMVPCLGIGLVPHAAVFAAFRDRVVLDQVSQSSTLNRPIGRPGEAAV
jgi:hypothetical protein